MEERVTSKEAHRNSSKKKATARQKSRKTRTLKQNTHTHHRVWN